MGSENRPEVKCDPSVSIGAPEEKGEGDGAYLSYLVTDIQKVIQFLTDIEFTAAAAQ